MVYNFNLGIGWASSGVEYAQAYRARLLRGSARRPDSYSRICSPGRISSI